MTSDFAGALTHMLGAKHPDAGHQTRHIHGADLFGLGLRVTIEPVPRIRRDERLEGKNSSNGRRERNDRDDAPGVRLDGLVARVARDDHAPPRLGSL